MSVWISDEKLLIFASLISPSKMILFEKKYQTFDTVFHHQMKHLEVRQKYSAARRTLFSVFHLVMKHCVSCLIYYIKILHNVFAGHLQSCLPWLARDQGDKGKTMDVRGSDGRKLMKLTLLDAEKE